MNVSAIGLTASGGIGAFADPVRIGQTSTVSASNSASGGIYLSYTAGNATLNGITNTAGVVNVAVASGTLNTGTLNVSGSAGVTLLASGTGSAAAGANLTVGTGGVASGAGAVNLSAGNGNIITAGAISGANGVTLAASDSGITGGANLSVGAGVTSSAGTINLYAADNVTVAGIVNANTNVNIVAGTVANAALTGFNGGANAVTESVLDTAGTVMVDSNVTAGGNVTIQATNRVGPAITSPQLLTQLGAIVATGQLKVQTYNDAAQTGTINLQHTGNGAASLVLETRLGTSASPPYAASNIFYKSSSAGLTLAGLGTAATVALDAASWVLTAAPAALGATDLVLNATGTNGTIVVDTDLSNASINGGNAGGSLTLNAHGSITLNKQIGASGSNPLPSAPANTTVFNHNLNLRAGGSINVNGSIIVSGALAFQANLDQPTLNTLSPALNFAGLGATAGGGVAVTAPNGTGAEPGMLISAGTINVGSLANRVQHFVLDGSAVVAAGGVDRTTTIRAGTFNIFTLSTSTQPDMATRVNVADFSTYAIPIGASGTGDVVIKAGTAQGNSASKAGVMIDVGNFSAKVGGNLIFKAGKVLALGGIADAELKVASASVTVDVGGNLVIAGGNTTAAGATGGRSAFARFDPLNVNTGQSLTLIGGYGANTFALLTSPNDINIKVNQAVGAPATFTGGGITGAAAGLITAGGTGTGTFNYNLISNKIELYVVNTLPIGALSAPITLVGGPATIVALPFVSGIEASGGSVLSNVPVIPGIDLGQQIHATESTRITNENNSKKNTDSGEGC